MAGKANPVPPVKEFQPGTAARMVEVAKSQVGVIEGPADNETDYGKFTGHDKQPWCGSLMMWCAKQAGVTIPNTVYTPAGVDAFKKMGAWADAAKAHPQPGDLVYFSFVPAATPSSSVQHVGIVVKDNGDGTITTIEGNTSADGRTGSQNNGGEAALKVRGYKVDNKRHIWSSVVGFGRPVYKDSTAPAVNGVPAPTPADNIPPFPGRIAPGDSGEGVKLIQQALGIDADSEYGPMTKKAVIAIQNEHDHLDSNGIVGPATWAEIMKHLA
jgi:CHAP domain/Putative peptidoglycan binding domain